ncbi:MULTISPECIES: multidrug effflux MFS transporter [Bartonella]|uniref:Bcr/CflA family efflux transporter n=1 Tax=Bartonella rochalimae ATCC BAA-1498 TaxID=685782 RepID=E6YLL1_9HYPH|nr:MULTISPECIES: multidrug effflux MFS transporter [Bartonella]AQX18420.1 MFS transporter, DHA1 family, bicyclomycin/chloramphenicol resistance protein [Bartonella sp. A1379B]AQX22933.1 MFS transporter, DHA1 family, bicyclomycin/chloramphenicol resistance protein [Bartonella sp. 11B]AQX23772.1 MFS transporter, DHA1 family, bicyclomycin/chloramphenicol resistance protein [Bartonella sp. 114]AQX25386.1 MFS transporter, DHA1 family, bicyclomycin/chloramphenicol resistance protein [Bartonella sp. C
MSYSADEQKHIDTIKKKIGYKEFVILIAALMAINSIAIDIMLPAMPDILNSLHATHENDQHYIISCYLISYGATQIFFGPISDRYGRHKLTLIGLACYSFAAIGCIFVSSFHILLILRILQGVGGAAMRVLTISIIRDLYDGRKMAEVMSIVMMIFLLATMIGPAIGQIILLFGQWQLIFIFMAIVGFGLMIWIQIRLPETLYTPRSLSFSSVKNNLRLIITNRSTLCYTLATSIILGCIFTAINTSQQVYEGIYNLGMWFPAAFALGAAFQAVSSFLNSRLVGHFGMRRISHTMLLLFASISCIWFFGSVLKDGVISFPFFMILYCMLMFTCGGIMANFNTLALEPLGKIAGTASSVSGFLQTSIGTGLGFFIAQCFDETTIPNSAGFFFLSLTAILLVLWAEHGRFFTQHNSESI